jgi:spermidine synthase
MTLRRLFLLIYGASGAAALIYEVTWTRLLTLEMGHGVAAASTVLAAFMGGLAIGAAVGGRYGGRLSPAGALRTYAGLEVAIALLALLLPMQLAALHPLFVTTYANGDSAVAFPLVRLVSSLLLVAIPAAAMGATFPIASRWMVPDASRAAGAAGQLYASNTVGAALGALTAGFVLLPALGLSGATWVGVAINLAVAVASWAIAARVGTAPAGAEARRAEPTRPKRDRRGAKAAPAHAGLGLPWVAATALGLSGFASLALQVVWTRLLALILGPTTYAFSVIVSTFIAGLAIGSAVAAPLAARSRHPMLGLALCLLASVALAAAAAAGVDWALLSMAAAVTAPDAAFGTVLARQVVLVGTLLVPMTVAFGAAFPFAVAVGTKDDATVVSDLGLIYAVNTVGAIVGALAAGFLLVPQLGLHNTIRLVVILMAAGTAVLLLVSPTTARTRLAGLAAAAAVLFPGVALPGWNASLLSSGAYKYASAASGLDLTTSLTAGRLLYYREGASATVAVREVAGTTSLSIDGKVDASNAGDMLTQRLLAHIPLLLHPEPTRVAILGLGSGVTLGSALRHPIEAADVLEISPEVVEASRFFEPENHQALADPRTRLIIGDGRTHLRLSRDQYDVIVSEPSNPWMAGIAALFTREFFEAARARLSPGGLLCQWAHTYDISEQDLKSIVATFLSVFPDGTLWLVGEGDVLLVGSTEPLDARLGEVGRHISRPGVRSDLLTVGVRDTFGLLSAYVAGGTTLAAYAGEAPLQTDNRAGLEFSGPRSIFGPQPTDNAEVLREIRRTSRPPAAVQRAFDEADAAAWRSRGTMMLQASAFAQAWLDLREAVELDPTDAESLQGLLRAAVLTGRVPDTLDLLQRIAADPARVQARLARSRLMASQGAVEEAAAIAFDLVQRYPGNLRTWEQLASVLSDAGDIERLQPVVVRMRQDAPDSEITRYYTAALLFMEGRAELAAREAEAVVRANPRHARAHNLLGAALATLGERDRARDAFLASLRADPHDPATYTNLGMLERQSGNVRAAAERFAEALTLDPTQEAARLALAELQPRR